MLMLCTKYCGLTVTAPSGARDSVPCLAPLLGYAHPMSGTFFRVRRFFLTLSDIQAFPTQKVLSRQPHPQIGV